MEIDACSAAAAAEAARAQAEDRDKQCVAAVKEAKDRASELDKRLETEQQKRLLLPRRYRTTWFACNPAFHWLLESSLHSWPATLAVLREAQRIRLCRS